MKKFNIAFLLIALAAFNTNVFCMEEKNPASNLGESQFQDIVGNSEKEKAAESRNKDEEKEQVLNDSTQGSKIVPQTLGDDGQGQLKIKNKLKSEKPCFCKNGKIALASLLGCSFVYLVYKYFSGKNDQEQSIDEAIE